MTGIINSSAAIPPKPYIEDTFDDVEEAEDIPDPMENRNNPAFINGLFATAMTPQPRESDLLKPASKGPEKKPEKPILPKHKNTGVKSSIAALGAQLMRLPGPATGKKPTTTTTEPVPRPSPLFHVVSAHLRVDLDLEELTAEMVVDEPPEDTASIPSSLITTPVTDDLSPSPTSDETIPTPPPLDDEPTTPVTSDTASTRSSSDGSIPPDGRVEASLHGRVIRLEYKKSDVVHAHKEVKTIYGFFALIMNIFSAMFPCNRGAAKIEINGESFYVRRSLVKEVLDHVTISKKSLRYNSPEFNMSELKAAALIHFKA